MRWRGIVNLKGTSQLFRTSLPLLVLQAQVTSRQVANARGKAGDLLPVADAGRSGTSLNLPVKRKEALSLVSRLEVPHLSLPLPSWFVGHLRPIVGVPRGVVARSRQGFAHSRWVASQLVGNQYPLYGDRGADTISGPCRNRTCDHLIKRTLAARSWPVRSMS